MSHPLRVRGLKLPHRRQFWQGYVASFTGAWIETADKTKLDKVDSSHPLRVRGLKLVDAVARAGEECRILYGCVD